MSNYLTKEQVNQLNEKRGWFEFGDAQSDVSMAFAQDAIAMYLAATEAAKATGTAGELPAMPDPLEINWPELNSNALGCGVEDRGIHDRYEAAEYGWQDGVDKAIERVPEAIYDADQMREYGQACAEAAIQSHIAENGDPLYWRGRAVQAEAARQPAPVVAAIIPDWPACNPACDYEDPRGIMHDNRSSHCNCEEAKESICRQRAALAATAAPVLSDEQISEIADNFKFKDHWQSNAEAIRFARAILAAITTYRR